MGDRAFAGSAVVRPRHTISAWDGPGGILGELGGRRGRAGAIV